MDTPQHIKDQATNEGKNDQWRVLRQHIGTVPQQCEDVSPMLEKRWT